MLLDNRTLLFSLTLVSAMMALSLAVVSWGREHDSLKKWAGAMALESLAFSMSAARGAIPDIFAIVFFGALLVSAWLLCVGGNDECYAWCVRQQAATPTLEEHD